MSIIQRKDDSCPSTSLCKYQLKLQKDQRQQEKSVIAQPTFVFEKGEQSFKRPAEDTLHETAEDESNHFSRKRARSSSFTLNTTDSQSQEVLTLSQKRLRSSSFTDIPTFPPSGPVRKNNVFMMNLMQRNVNTNSAEQGSVKHSEHVLRPAILQPPQTQSCEKVNKTSGFNALEFCNNKEQTKHKISEGNSNLLNENLPNSRNSVHLATHQYVLGTTSAGCQSNGDKCSFQSCSSNFIFGENMVERVLSIPLYEAVTASSAWNSEFCDSFSKGTQKLTRPQLENDSYAKEKTFKSILKFPINSSNSRADSIKNISLLESAAAFSSRPSRKYLLEKIDVITGEETEHNVLKINCKIFILNKATESWIERGRGTLRLNDTASSDCGTLQSRLIMRNQGSLRLILNSKLWAEMKIQRANHKNLRITATDLEDYAIKVFLIQASAKDTGYLYAAIHHRLVALRSFNKQNDVNQAESQPETSLQQLSFDSCDEDEDDFVHVTKNGSDTSRWTHRQSVACS